MVEYFHKEELEVAKKQRDKALTLYIVIASIYLLASLGIFLWYTTLPYKSPTITVVKIIHYTLTAIMVIFSFVYLGIPFKRVNKFYKMHCNIVKGLKETSTGSFFEYDDTLQEKDGVDCKALIFLEWNKYKNDFFERKVLVFEEKEYPKFEEKMNVRYVTHGNVLVSYEILDNQTIGE